MLPTKLEALLASLIPANQLRCRSGDEPKGLKSLLPGSNVLITRGRAVDRDIVEAAGDALGLVHVLGRDPIWVDVEAVRRAGAVVATMPHGGAMAVADHTMALMLAGARQLVRGHRGVAGGDYREHGLSPSRTTEWSFAFNWLQFPDVVEINRKTLGLIGFGEVAREVARRARGFDMRVLYHSRRALPVAWERRLGVERAPLDRLFRESDVVSLHAPHTEQTERLVDEARLRSMKPTAWLINTSRGALVDEAALARALEESVIAGAALDVFVEEPLPADHALASLDNVVLAPHVGGGSGGGQKLLMQQVVENIVHFAGGGDLRNVWTDGNVREQRSNHGVDSNQNWSSEM